jgi:hypothetical protein
MKFEKTFKIIDFLSVTIRFLAVTFRDIASYVVNIHGNSKKKLSLSIELSHEFELNTQTQNSPKMSH